MIYLLKCDDEKYTAKLAEMLKDSNVSVCCYDKWENFQSDIRKKKMESIFLDKNRCFPIVEQKEEVLIHLEHVKYIESDKNYLIWHMLNGKYYRNRMTVKRLLETLDYEAFFRVSSKYVINMKYVDSYKNYRLYMHDGTEMSISRRFYQQFRFLFGRYCIERNNMD